MTVEPTGIPREEEVHGGRRERAPDAMDTRGRSHLFWDIVFVAIRGIAGVARNFYLTFGIFLVAGGLVARPGQPTE